MPALLIRQQFRRHMRVCINLWGFRRGKTKHTPYWQPSRLNEGLSTCTGLPKCSSAQHDLSVGCDDALLTSVKLAVRDALAPGHNMPQTARIPGRYTWLAFALP